MPPEDRKIPGRSSGKLPGVRKGRSSGAFPPVKRPSGTGSPVLPPPPRKKIDVKLWAGLVIGALAFGLFVVKFLLNTEMELENAKKRFLEKQLKPEDRLGAIWEMSNLLANQEYGPKKVLPVIENELLGSDDTTARWMAAALLRYQETEDAYQMLKRAFAKEFSKPPSKGDAVFRTALCFALDNHFASDKFKNLNHADHRPEITKKLEEAYADPRLPIRIAASRSHRRVNENLQTRTVEWNPEGRLFVPGAPAKPQFIAEWMLDFLDVSYDDGTAPFLRIFARKSEWAPHPYIRYKAATLLARHHDPACIPVFEEAIRPDNPSGLAEANKLAQRLHSLDRLGELDQDATFPLLVNTLLSEAPAQILPGAKEDPLVAKAKAILIRAGARAVPALQKGLDDERATQRYYMVSILSEIPDPSTIPLLIGRLKRRDSDEQVRAAVARGLGNFYRHEGTVLQDMGILEQLIESLNDDTEIVRRNAIESLRRIAIVDFDYKPDRFGPQARGEWIQRFRDWHKQNGKKSRFDWLQQAAKYKAGDPKYREYSDVRRRAIEAFAEVANKEALEKLVDRLGDEKDFSIRRLAAQKLSAFYGGSAMVKFLSTQLVESTNWWKREMAAHVLGRLRYREAVVALAKGTEDRSAHVRLAAAMSLGEQGAYEGAPALVKLLQKADEYEWVKKPALVALARCHDPTSIPALQELLQKEKDEANLQQIAKALAELGHPSALDFLMQLAEDESKPMKVREEAAKGVGIAHGTAFGPRLMALLKKAPPKSGLQFACAVSLGRFRDTSSLAVPSVLLEALDDRAWRGEAAEALGVLKPDDPSAAIPKLLACTALPAEAEPADVEAAAKAVEALGSIAPEDAAADGGTLSGKVEALVAGPHERVGLAAVRSLGSLVGRGGKKSLEALAEEIKKGRALPAAVRIEAGETLCQLQQGNPTVTLSLQEAIESDVPEIRAVAARALGYVGDPSVVRNLIELLTDPEWRVVHGAAEALVRLNDPYALDYLVRDFDCRMPEVRRSAAQALARLHKKGLNGQPDSQFVVPWLLDVLEDNLDPEKKDPEKEAERRYAKKSANQTLHDLTGQNVAFDVDGYVDDQQRALDQWKEWWRTNGQGLAPPPLKVLAGKPAYCRDASPAPKGSPAPPASAKAP